MGGGLHLPLLAHNSSTNNHHHHREGPKNKNHAHHVPKGYVVIKAGTEGEEQQRFVVPVVHLNHPHFKQLLKGAEEEYGFHQKGAVAVPCTVAEFQHVQDLIHQENSAASGSGGFGNEGQHGNGYGTFIGCFKARVYI